MSQADELLRELVWWQDARDRIRKQGLADWTIDDPSYRHKWDAARAYLNEKPHEPPAAMTKRMDDWYWKSTQPDASPPHAEPVGRPTMDATKKLVAQLRVAANEYRIWQSGTGYADQLIDRAADALIKLKLDLDEAASVASRCENEQAVSRRVISALRASPSAQPIAREIARYKWLRQCTAGEWDRLNGLRIDKGMGALDDAIDIAIKSAGEPYGVREGTDRTTSGAIGQP